MSNGRMRRKTNNEMVSVEQMTQQDSPEADDIFIYSIDHALEQIVTAPITLGFYTLRFYSDGNRPMKHRTELIEMFYYYPSGGTLRDKDMNIVFYEPRLDKYHQSNKLPKELEGGAFDRDEQ
jgi:hypothetical protein